MVVDMHSHLRGWSPDAVQTIEELLSAAEDKRLNGIAVTDHYDLDNVSDSGTKWIFDPKQYYETHLPFRKAPSLLSRAGVLIGVEISYLPNHIEEIKRLAATEEFDAVILSVHEYDHIDPVIDCKNLFQDGLSAAYGRIIHAIAESAMAVPAADIIGHYDFFSRYAPTKRSKMLYSHAPDEFDRLFCIMIQNHQALEINTGTVDGLPTYLKRTKK